MIEIQEKIHKLIKDNTSKLGEVDFNIEHPNDLSHGDYATNVALILAKKISTDTGKNTNPKQVADLLVEKLNKDLPKEIESVSVAGPGFINFHLTQEFFQDSLKEVLNKEQDFGKNKLMKREKVLIEYTDPNPFKQFHIGHLMSNSIGEAISRLYVWSGAKVQRACYQGDVGLHVAKAIWGMKQLKDEMPDEKSSLSEKTAFLGKAYVLGANSEKEDEIKEVNQQVYDLYNDDVETDTEVKELYDIGKKWSLLHFEEIYAKLGTKFDYYIMESSVSDLGIKLVKENVGKVFEESEGAIVYKGEQDGLHTRVFINSQGLPTYETKDLGNAIKKDRLGRFDKSVVITAEEQKEYFKVMLAALDKIDDDVAEKIQHITHGMMQFADGKMSSRTGNVITGESLIEDIEEVVREKMKDREVENVEEIVSQIAVAAIKYSILKQTPGKNIIFNQDQATSFEGDSGPYVQYTCNRCRSILEKAKDDKKSENVRKVPEGWETTKLERMMYQFPEVVIKSVTNTEPHHVTNYMIQLASEYNSFYANTQILDGGDSEGYKLGLTHSTLIVLRNCLSILGIKVPNKM